MILYLNTSALVKLYMEEPGSKAVRALLERAQVVSASRVAYMEMRAGLARKLCQGELREEEYRHILSDFEKDWKNYFVIEVSEGVAQWGGELVGKNILFGPSMPCILPQRFSLGSGYAQTSFSPPLMEGLTRQLKRKGWQCPALNKRAFVAIIVATRRRNGVCECEGAP
jgi:hypothetical protein